jgi:FdhD protein
MATIVCTPEHMGDLVLGFLASEGVIRTVDQVQQLTISRFRGTARVRTTTSINFNQAFYNKRYIASCCGKSRQSFYFVNDAHTAKFAEDSGLRIHPKTVLRLIHEMESSSSVFRVTGGVHTGSLCDVNGLLLSRSDIGRHNALDKLYGYCLRHRITTGDKIVAFSGRLSSEVLLKVAKMGVGIVLAKSAPTAMALDMAQELNITAVGFVRGDAFNVYTHPWRIER